MTSKQVNPPAGAVRTTAGAVRPVSGVRMTGGLLHDWRRRNSTATIPHTIEQLRAAGNVANPSRLLEPDPAPYPFLGTDLYKTLEGLASDLGDGDAAEPCGSSTRRSSASWNVSGPPTATSTPSWSSCPGRRASGAISPRRRGSSAAVAGARSSTPSSPATTSRTTCPSASCRR
ncbi:hypothetical protein [Nonomuraea sp. B5E05]|uniref:hypothetical protein n=1 Tax=Nonomuraea sp. B5E05 TaxID=3153569 RepID=UPI00325FF131